MAYVSVAENATYETAISNTKTDPSVQNVINLGGHLRGVARYNSSTGRSPYYDKIRETLIAIPGHAQYFADEIKREQKAVQRYPTNTGPRVSYDFSRTRSFDTLGHLPSPATIAVLGHFLSDDIDTPSELESPGSDWGPNPKANSYFSSTTIMNIGLRNPPVTSQRRNDDPVVRLAETRAWWEEIKSGKRAFSFLGQKVEYRFKPDGTWDAITLANPPDDAPRPPKMAPANTQGQPNQKRKSGFPVAVERSGRSPWLWVITAVCLLSAGGIWVKMRRG